jgi:large subunit ribosomal protein L4
MKLDILNKEGKATGNQVTLDDAIFGIEPNQHAVYLNVKLYLANQRQGTHDSLERWAVSGSTKKLHKQKGTGGSRKGSVKNIMFPGGPRAFGPHPRDYGFKLNAKQKDLAKRSILSAKAKSNNIKIVEDFDLDAPKTKSYLTFLSNMNVQNTKTLLITGESKKNLILSSRNVPRNAATTADLINAYQLINADTLILSVSGVKRIEEILK